MRQRGGREQPVKGRRANRSKTRKVSTAASPIADLQKQVGTLTRELKDSREQQTATSNILKVISRSTLDLQQVFETLAESAVRLCSAECGFVFRFDGQLLRFVVGHNVSPEFRDFLERNPITPGRGSNAGRAAIERHTVHNLDVQSDPEYNYGGGRVDPYRTVLAVPMLKADELFGVFVIYRHEVRPFNDSQIALMETFADQAVIAIENTRLLTEQREALERQTATAEVLQVINSSPGDLTPVFQTILEKAHSFCGVSHGSLQLYDGEKFRAVAAHGIREAFANQLRQGFVPGPNHPSQQLLEGARFAQVPDCAEIDDPIVRAAFEISGIRTVLLIPLCKEGSLLGQIAAARRDVSPFTEKEIALLENFAAQAVIAIENARLFGQVQAKTSDLEESLQFQTATSNVLRVISRSPDNLQPVLDVIVETSRELCTTDASSIFLLRDQKFYLAAISGSPPVHLGFMQANPLARDAQGSVLPRAVREKRTIHIPNVADDPELSHGSSGRGGPRALLATPLMSEGEAIGVLVLRQSHLKPFTKRQIEAVETFADQAVIAISNVNLFEQVQQRTRELSQSLDHLRNAQDRLVQTEKLASLGQLTAGIAHEIKNPLNFVNNFSALAVELVDELNDVLDGAGLNEKRRGELDEIRKLLKSNVEKVVQHGKRADSIVKNMLLHSRSGSGEYRPVEINAVIDESLNLAYHGARAEGKGFNITLERDFDPAAGVAEIYPQEITRVFLNLVSNGFYAATKRAMEVGNSFEPRLTAVTRNLGDRVEIRIRDNGVGISSDIKEKIFNPFFTTKPAGEGTGLGLSMSHDIVVKQHGGTIDVTTEPGAFTEFIITLPRTAPAQEVAGGPRREHLYPRGR